MRLFRQRIKNEADQIYVARIYFFLVLALQYRSNVGALLPQIVELTIFDPHSIALIFFGFAFYLRRAQPIHLLLYIVLLLPLAIFSGYVVFSMFTNLESSVVLAVFVGAVWFKIIEDLKKAVEAL